MRTYTFSNGVTATYPNYLTYLGDDNYINFNYSSGHIDARVIIGTYTLSYDSQIADVTFRINDVLRKVRTNNNDLTIQIKCDNGLGVLETFTFTIKAMLGKSLPQRHHASNSIIVDTDYDTFETIDFLFPCAGTLSDNASTPHTIVKSVAGIYSIDVSDFENLENVTFTAASGQSVSFGERWNAKQNTFNYTFVEQCIPNNGIVVRYYDTDGCERQAVGVVSNIDTSNDTSIFNAGGIFNRSASFHLNNVECELSIVFDDVDPRQHLEDMLFSQEIWVVVGNDTISLQPTSSINNDGKFNDITINFKVLC